MIYRISHHLDQIEALGENRNFREVNQSVAKCAGGHKGVCWTQFK